MNRSTSDSPCLKGEVLESRKSQGVSLCSTQAHEDTCPSLTVPTAESAHAQMALALTLALPVLCRM